MDLNQELLSAVEDSNLPLVKELLDRGADRRLSHLALERGESGLLRQSQRSARAEIDPNIHGEFKNTPLMLAIKEDNLEMVKVLLNRDADPNLQDRNGESALIKAVNQDNLEMVKILLKYGADPNLESDYKETSLFTAVRKDNLEIVKELLKRGADSNHQNSYFKQTPLFWAVEKNSSLEVVKELLNYGADPNLQDLFENTALIEAVKKGNFEIVKDLLNHNADPNLQDKNGDTALIEAVKKDNFEIFKELLNHGADPNLQNKNRITPLFWAVENNNFEILKELLNRTDISVQNEEGELALEAAYGKSKEMADLLIEHGAKINPNIPLTKLYHLPFYPIERYPLTGRPIASMPFLTLGPCSGFDYLPIIRFQSLYYSKNPSQEAYCGTFYFFEPDSNIFLSLGNYLLANNKFHAYLLLLSYVPVEEQEEINVHLFKEFERMTGIYLRNGEIISRKITEEDVPYYFDGDYYGNDFLGDFDSLDQIICLAGIEAGYDTIILQAEPGESRTVTEILDLRPREESFKDVCEVDTPLFHQLAEKSKYPAIWFKSYGFLQVNNSSK